MLMTPARRHLARIAAEQARIAGAPTSMPAPEPREAAVPLEPTLGQRHRMHHAGVAAVALTAAANDNTPDSSRAPDPVALVRMDLAHDLRGLKELKSREAKVARKRELLPKFDAYVEGVIDAAEAARARDPSFRAPQDDVVVRMLIWRLDTGDLPAAAALFTFAQTHGFQLGPLFKRDLPTMVAEEAADHALDAVKAGTPIPRGHVFALQAIRDAVAGLDMPDEVKGRLHKAIGLEITRAAGEATSPADAAAARDAALSELTRARQLDPRGAKIDNVIQRLEREAKAAATAAASTQAASTAADAGAGHVTPSTTDAGDSSDAPPATPSEAPPGEPPAET